MKKKKNYVIFLNVSLKIRVKVLYYSKMIALNEINAMNAFANCDRDSDEDSYLNKNFRTTYLNMESFSTDLRIIECSIEFLQIGEVDTMNERYQAIVKTKSKWYENEILTEYDPKKNWNPRLYIENALHEKFQEEINYKIVTIDKRTLITEIRISKGKIIHCLNWMLKK